MIYVLVSTALREPFESRFSHTKDTWEFFDSRGMRVIRMVGNSPFEETTYVGNTLATPVQESWENMGLKLWHALQWINARGDCQGVLKLDDDVEILQRDEAEVAFRALFRHEYASFQAASAKEGDVSTYAQTRVDDSSVWKNEPFKFQDTYSYASGSCMFLGPKAVKVLSSQQSLSTLAQGPFEDANIGLVLSRHGIGLHVHETSSVVWQRLDKTLGSSETI
jgi:hypothetical protein